MLQENIRIREKFRQQIRDRQVKEMMRLNRARIIAENNCQNALARMNLRIMEAAKLPFDMQIVHQLHRLLEQYPQNQNIYVLIGNYVSEHPFAAKCFSTQLIDLIDSANRLQNYRWALTIVLTKMEGLNKQILDDFDRCFGKIIELATTQKQICQSFDTLNIMLVYEQMHSESKYFPKVCVQQYLKKVAGLYFKDLELRQQSSYKIVAIMHAIADNYLDEDLIRHHIPTIIKIITLGISIFAIFRSDLIIALRTIIVRQNEQFQDLTNTEIGRQVIIQLMYLFEHVHTQRQQILGLFKDIVETFSCKNLVQLLNEGFHITILLIFQEKEPNSTHLQLCLTVIFNILNKIRDFEGDQLCDKVLTSMQNKGFSQKLQNLTQNKLDPRVERILAKLLDQYYSDEVELQ